MNRYKAGLSVFLKELLVIDITIFKRFIKIYFALITIHVLFVYYIKNLLGVSINNPMYVGIKMWKEIVIAVLILMSLIHTLKSTKRIKINILDLLIIAFVSLGLIYTVLAPNIVTGIWSFRSIFEIFAFYMFGRMFFLNGTQLNSFLYTLVIMGCLTSVFGIIQVNFLGPDFFKDVYGVNELATATRGFGYDKLRASSTFITPHEFGLFLVLCFMFSSYLYTAKVTNRTFFILSTTLIMIGLAFSLSRSSILILVICYGLYWVKDIRSIIFFAIIAIIGAFVFVLIGAIENFVSVLDGSDPSSMGRFVVFNSFLEHVKDYPFGSGLGTVGVVVRRFIPNAPQFEGEIFNIFAMMSIVGGLFYLIILGYSILIIGFNRSNQDSLNPHFLKMVAIIILALTLREIILPRDFTNYVIGWFLIGSTISSLSQKNKKVQWYIKQKV